MKFTKIPTDTFEKLQLNAGILVDEFTPATGTIGNLIGATTGGVQFQDNVTFTDFGEDIDNCPKNTKELKRIDQHEVTMSSTFVTVSASLAELLAGAADTTTTSGVSKITPRNTLTDADFEEEIWWVGDYSDKNGTNNGGYVAIKLINALNTGGFQLQTGDKSKGQFPFTLTGHYSIANQDVVPYEVYVKTGTAEPA